MRSLGGRPLKLGERGSEMRKVSDFANRNGVGAIALVTWLSSQFALGRSNHNFTVMGYPSGELMGWIPDRESALKIAAEKWTQFRYEENLREAR